MSTAKSPIQGDVLLGCIHERGQLRELAGMGERIALKVDLQRCQVVDRTRAVAALMPSCASLPLGRLLCSRLPGSGWPEPDRPWTVSRRRGREPLGARHVRHWSDDNGELCQRLLRSPPGLREGGIVGAGAQSGDAQRHAARPGLPVPVTATNRLRKTLDALLAIVGAGLGADLIVPAIGPPDRSLDGRIPSCRHPAPQVRQAMEGRHRRCRRVETTLHCVKLLGQRLMARDFDRQVAELQIRIAVLNG
ncbi:hypothetical protein ROA7023_03448 [Roseisalinus antarcticus]|uniref:Transposase DDE domain-containing protein n=1 Tax=Roseisalinus antarcticus TaxID=254357 RepID=A0A1Y5TX79_9RHOB|nr:hypothetical protein ROA7023_03448 [Roseisalinus antarcticus]